MLLVIDAGNTNVTIGVYREDELLFVSRLSTDRTITGDEFAISINSIFELNSVEPSGFDGSIISSVVPELTRAIKNGVKKVTGTEPIIVGPGVKTGLNIKLDNPAELGSDLACTAVGAFSKYELPCIIVDLGTATKITVVDEGGAFLGGAIAPGLLISLDALSNGASMLSSIALHSPKKTIGSNTTECLRSGIVFGNAEMLDGLIDRMQKELPIPAKSIVSTGGLSPVVVKHCKHEMIYDRDLLLYGLKIIFEKNKL